MKHYCTQWGTNPLNCNCCALHLLKIVCQRLNGGNCSRNSGGTVLPHHSQHFVLIARAIWRKLKKIHPSWREEIIYLQQQATLKLIVHNYMAKYFSVQFLYGSKTSFLLFYPSGLWSSTSGFIASLNSSLCLFLLQEQFLINLHGYWCKRWSRWAPISVFIKAMLRAKFYVNQ